MRRPKRCGFSPWVGKIPWRSAWQPTPVFLPGESPWTEEPSGLQSIGVAKSWTQLNQHHTHTHDCCKNSVKYCTEKSLNSMLDSRQALSTVYLYIFLFIPCAKIWSLFDFNKWKQWKKDYKYVKTVSWIWLWSNIIICSCHFFLHFLANSRQKQWAKYLYWFTVIR